MRVSGLNTIFCEQPHTVQKKIYLGFQVWFIRSCKLYFFSAVLHWKFCLLSRLPNLLWGAHCYVFALISKEIINGKNDLNECRDQGHMEHSSKWCGNARRIFVFSLKMSEIWAWLLSDSVNMYCIGEMNMHNDSVSWSSLFYKCHQNWWSGWKSLLVSVVMGETGATLIASLFPFPWPKKLFQKLPYKRVSKWVSAMSV